MGREDEIRLIAYRIWEEDGCCDGRDLEHWFRAEVIWEEPQMQENAAKGSEPASKRTPKQGKKNRTRNKKR